MDAYLEMILGNKAGSVYTLRGEAENQIGCGRECEVAVTDPLCSRVHAIVRRNGDDWRLWDAMKPQRVVCQWAARRGRLSDGPCSDTRGLDRISLPFTC